MKYTKYITGYDLRQMNERLNIALKNAKCDVRVINIIHIEDNGFGPRYAAYLEYSTNDPDLVPKYSKRDLERKCNIARVKWQVRRNEKKREEELGKKSIEKSNKHNILSKFKWN